MIFGFHYKLKPFLINLFFKILLGEVVYFLMKTRQALFDLSQLLLFLAMGQFCDSSKCIPNVILTRLLFPTFENLHIIKQLFGTHNPISLIFIKMESKILNQQEYCYKQLNLIILCQICITYNHKQMSNNKVLEMLKSGPLKQSGILEHLCQLIRTQLSSTNQLKNLNQIQILSYFLRTHAFRFKELLDDQKLRQKIYKNKQYTEYIEKLEQLTSSVKKTDPNKNLILPNLNAEYQAFKTAGISIGESNYFYLNKVLKLVASKNNVKQIRFWGKILGRKDYYVLQGISKSPYLNQLSKDGQGYGVGVNSYSYWVSNDILGEWTQLPLVTPSQIKSSREFKYIFSGDLQSDISGFIKFIGKQKHLLKCIVARITHASYLAPKGLYKVSEADPSALEFQQSEQGFKLPEVNELATLQNWVHLPANILSHGRTTHYIDPSLLEEQKEALKAELEQKQPLGERLKGIVDDKPYEYNGYSAPNNWTVQLCGETIPVSLIGKQEGQSAVYGVALLKNLSWPGSATVGYRGGWASLYVGYGHRSTQQLKIIKQLADLQLEGNDVDQKPEPNPSKVVVQKQPQVEPPQDPQDA